MFEVKYESIGIIHSPFEDIHGVPIQPAGAKGVKGSVEIKQEYVDGLKDIEGFSHIILIYHFHLSQGFSLHIKPFLDNKLHGVFATRAPRRPNPIGISVVNLEKVDGNILHVKDVDIVDGTPLLDLKPYVPEFDIRNVEHVGWLSKIASKVYNAKSDERFR